MLLSPSKIFQYILEEQINLNEGIKLLITIMENNQDKDLRLNCLKYLKLLDIECETIYPLLESLMISDTDEKIRSFAVVFMGEKCIDRALLPMSWAIEHEKNYFCQISIIKALAQINKESVKKILTNELKKIASRQYIGNQNLYSNRYFLKSIEYNDSFSWENFMIPELADILINYKTISNLIKKFYYVFFEWKNGLIVKLDLSELGWNVSRAWRFIYAGRLTDLNKIPELFNLKFIESLDLSNNRLESIHGLHRLPKITHLYLRNNKLEDLENIKYIKKFENLKHIDLRGNKIADYVEKEDFSNLNLILKDNLVFM